MRGVGAKANDDDGEDDGWTPQHSVSPLRDGEHEEAEADAEADQERGLAPVKPSVARAAIPTGLDEADHFKYKNVDL